MNTSSNPEPSQFLSVDSIQKKLDKAIEQLDRTKTLTKSKSDLRDLTAKRTLFTEQFLNSDSFQNFEEAKGFAAVERWNECLHELDSIGAGDQDNVLVLRQRAACLQGTAEISRNAAKMTRWIAPCSTVVRPVPSVSVLTNSVSARSVR